MRRLNAAEACNSAEFSAAAFFFSLHFSPKSAISFTGSVSMCSAKAPPFDICLIMVANTKASGLLCAPCVAGLTISSSTNLNTATAASHAFFPFPTLPSPLQRHSEDLDSHSNCASHSFVEARTFIRAVEAGMTYPAATSVDTVACDSGSFESSNRRACRVFMDAFFNRLFPTSPSSADCTASFNTLLANSSHL